MRTGRGESARIGKQQAADVLIGFDDCRTKLDHNEVGWLRIVGSLLAKGSSSLLPSTVDGFLPFTRRHSLAEAVLSLALDVGWRF